MEQEQTAIAVPTTNGVGPPGTPGKSKTSGYGRLKTRHRAVLGELDKLKGEVERLMADNILLLSEVERLKSTKAATGGPWKERAAQYVQVCTARNDGAALLRMSLELSQLQTEVAKLMIGVSNG